MLSQNLSGSELSRTSVYNPDFLRKQTRWIRDELDPQIARDGPDALHSDEILRLDEFLRRLLVSNISREDLRYSRIHLAVLLVSGRATRWPKRLVDRCDVLLEAWEAKYGSMNELGTLLYEPGGRLHGICNADDLSPDKLMIKWLKSPGKKPSPLLARRYGDLGFTPGNWWINPMFAFRDGIIDQIELSGGIVSDGDGAYAVLMSGGDELNSPSPYAFTYRAKSEDRGRFRLTAGTPESRHPVRILRAHSLRSLWTPAAGVRYDGLHKVVGWSIKTEAKRGRITYEISFKRLASELSMDTVLARPWTDEVEDYQEYKRLRQLTRGTQQNHTKGRKTEAMPPTSTSADGTFEVFEDETAESPFQRWFTDRIPDDIECQSEGRTVLRELPLVQRRDTTFEIE